MAISDFGFRIADCRLEHSPRTLEDTKEEEWNRGGAEAQRLGRIVAVGVWRSFRTAHSPFGNWQSAIRNQITARGESPARPSITPRAAFCRT